MKNIFAMMIMLSLLTVSCSKSGGGSSSEHSTAATDAATADNSTGGNNSAGAGGETTGDSAGGGETPTPSASVPEQALTFQTNVELIDFTATQEEKYNQAVELVKKVVATEAFRTRILSYTWNGARQFANNKGLTNAQIYQSVLDAAERLKPIKNNTMDLGVKLYYQNSTVVGYTSGSITYINVNTKFFNQFAINSVAGNLFHEWLHKLGYGHDSAATAQRPYSVPYAIGYIVRDIGKSFL